MCTSESAGKLAVEWDDSDRTSLMVYGGGMNGRVPSEGSFGRAYIKELSPSRAAWCIAFDKSTGICVSVSRQQGLWMVGDPDTPDEKYKLVVPVEE